MISLKNLVKDIIRIGAKSRFWNFVGKQKRKGDNHETKAECYRDSF